MNHRRTLIGFGVIGLVWACPGCTSRAGPTIAPDASDLGGELSRILSRQAAFWNQGDLEAFMRPYWRSPDLTFSSGGRVTRGWQPTLENYRKRYPNPAAMGHLTFDKLEITPLGLRAALVLGRWHLERDEPTGGAFTLVFRKLSGRWVIVHDHTSVDVR